MRRLSRGSYRDEACDDHSALRAYCPSFEGRVGGAAEYAAIDITNLPMPCAFVLPVSEIGEDMDSMGTDYRQRVKQVFCVVILVSTADQERGQDAFDAIEDLKAEIFKAILGTSTAETDEIVYEAIQIRILIGPGWRFSCLSLFLTTLLTQIRGMGGSLMACLI